ncbi:MAG: hypothetical protein DRJ62_05260 [Thermoprotei archaeon]|nr:MAG: hypothetical protein DRJ62_05260 [Thermoprotei archaeon]
MQLLDVCRRAVEEAVRAGADASDAYGVEANILKVVLEKGVVKRASATHDVGFGIRAVVRGSQGYSYSTRLNADPREVAVKAFRAARAGPPDPDFKSLPTPSSYPSISGLYDSKIASMGVEDLVDLCYSLVDLAKRDKVYSINMSVEAVEFKRFVANSNGVEGVDEGTLFAFEVYVTARDGINMASSSEANASRFYGGLDLQGMTLKASEEAVKYLNAKSYKSCTASVVFSDRVLATIFIDGVASALNADLVQRGRSYLAEKVGEKVAVEKLTVVDDGARAGGLLSMKFDCEGTPRGRTLLIDGGFVRGLLHNSYTSGKAGVKSTGNASRVGGDLDFRGRIAISPSNVVVEGGDWSLEEMIEEVKVGVLVEDTDDSPNIATGDLSAMMTKGYAIEGGEVKYPIKQTLFAINMLDLLRKIRALGKRRVKRFGLEAPPIMVSDVSIASKA